MRKFLAPALAGIWICFQGQGLSWAETPRRGCGDPRSCRQECRRPKENYFDCRNRGYSHEVCAQAKQGYLACRDRGFSHDQCADAGPCYLTCRDRGYSHNECREFESSRPSCTLREASGTRREASGLQRASRDDGQKDCAEFQDYAACRNRGYSHADCAKARNGYLACRDRGYSHAECRAVQENDPPCGCRNECFDGYSPANDLEKIIQQENLKLNGS